MSTDERKPNPNATIQLDQIEGALEQVQFESTPSLPTSSRKPPPLPPVMPTASGAPPATVSQAPDPPAKKLGAGMVVGFVVLLAVAIGGGLYVGLHARATAAAPVVTATAAPSVTPSATAVTAPSAPASVQHFTLPTIE